MGTLFFAVIFFLALAVYEGAHEWRRRRASSRIK